MTIDVGKVNYNQAFSKHFEKKSISFFEKLTNFQTEANFPHKFKGFYKNNLRKAFQNLKFSGTLKQLKKNQGIIA